MELYRYQCFNSSLRYKYIYRLGGSTGFFSEYNNMVLAILYCLINKIQFVLESEDANFSSGEGWREFFLPFCKEIKNKWLRKYNFRRKPVYHNRFDWFCFNVYKRIHSKYIYMYTLFDEIRKMDVHKEYSIPEIGLCGSLLENCREIHQMIWRYNAVTTDRIKVLIQSIHLPTHYIGMHIRLGDKDEEASLFQPTDYMSFAYRFSDMKNVFVLTDDYRAILTLRRVYPELSFYTLCQENERGYHLGELMKRSKQEQIQSYIRLWASMDVLEKSELFIGTYSANPGMNMGFRIITDRIKCLDFDDWQLW